MYIGLNVRYLYSCTALIKTEFSLQILEKLSNINLYEYPSSESRVVQCGRTDGQTDVTHLVVAFWQFCESAPKRSLKFYSHDTFACYGQC
jgi:hypothetical protein